MTLLHFVKLCIWATTVHLINGSIPSWKANRVKQKKTPNQKQTNNPPNQADSRHFSTVF